MDEKNVTCQNCKDNFIIGPDDLVFYEKFQVPAPTFCPRCRFQRRLMFLNERSLYWRECALCGKRTMSMFSPDAPYTVYCNPCWWSDKWDPGVYTLDYDPGKTFFEQLRELQLKVPMTALLVDYPRLINSEYCNNVANLKNCYLVYDADVAENMMYSSTINKGRDSMDVLMFLDSSSCYEGVNLKKCFRAFFSEDCSNCQDVYFSRDLSGCSNCVGCINLRNKKHHILNEPYSKEEYEKKVQEMCFDSFSSLQEFRKKAEEFLGKEPRRFMHGTHNVNVSGDYVTNSKNAHYMYQCDGVEDGKYCQRLTFAPAKDVCDYTTWGRGSQMIYDCIVVGENANNVKFSFSCWSGNTSNVEYGVILQSCSDSFGCIGLRKKKHCILNKQYSPEEYGEMVERIKQDMTENPYVDSKGRRWGYGEFFPYDLSYWDYNESAATQYYDLPKEEVESRGWRWYEKEPSEHAITMEADALPDSIKDVKDDITEEIVRCSDCSGAYRILKEELERLRQFNLPLPRNCPECRFRARMRKVNPPMLWERTCNRCGKTVQTGYDPSEGISVYCEECYQAEVI